MERWLRSAAARGVARARPLAPPPAWEAIVAARSLAGRGPVVLAPAAERALVLAPHPDDETIGCGGTLATLAAHGAEVHVLVATSGEASVADPAASAPATAAARQREAAVACAELGVHPPAFADLPDGRLGEHLPQLERRLTEVVSDLEPQVVFAPWPLDGHPDHRAAARAVAGVALAPDVEIWTYEVWSPLPANRVVDVTRAWDAKVRALACHDSTHHTFDPSAHLSLARWRSLFGLDGHGYAEAFLVVDPAGLRVLAGRKDDQ